MAKNERFYKTATWAQSYKTFYGRNLLTFVLS